MTSTQVSITRSSPLKLANDHDLKTGGESDYANLVVAYGSIDGRTVVISTFSDDVWWPNGSTTNTKRADSRIDFLTIHPAFRGAMKQVMYRYISRGREGMVRPGAATLVKTFRNMKLFVDFIASIGLLRFSQVEAAICGRYVQHCREHRFEKKTRRPANVRDGGVNLTLGALANRFSAVEAIYELSQSTFDKVPEPPWEDSSAIYLTGFKKRAVASFKTPLIPDVAFAAIFQEAWRCVKYGPELLAIRDAVSLQLTGKTFHSRETKRVWRDRHLATAGYQGTSGTFNKALTRLRTACYIVVASLSGCRNHELAYLKANSYYKSDIDGEEFWWMRSKSTKTGVGITEWMIPDAAVEALRVMDWWSIPYRLELSREINLLRASPEGDVALARLSAHSDAIFLGRSRRMKNELRTLSGAVWNIMLREFASDHSIKWSFSTHQFRRKFANYSARSQFGDLRYLREHFKHWSMDMTLGYAMNESQEMALYLEIQDELVDIKEETVDRWFSNSKSLSGGYGRNIQDWRKRTDIVVLFKSHKQMISSVARTTAIRSTGHSFCTADDDLCIGNDFEKTRCGDCSNAVIEPLHAPFYQGLLDHLSSLALVEDIGAGGSSRVMRDIARSRAILESIGAHGIGVDE